jgi:UDP-3-O-[3-hydroxymyristoyl] N-acetylglucosamine deacetylase
VQQTLSDGFRMEGVGLHSGRSVQVEVLPGPPNSGFVFERTDLAGRPRVRASWTHVEPRPLATCLVYKNAEVATVEHLLSALYGLGVDNALIRQNQIECPVLDGSAQVWCEAIARVGVLAQGVSRHVFRPIGCLEHQEDQRYLALSGGEGLRIEVVTEFPWVGREEIALELTPASYLAEVAWARTFAFEQDVEALRAAGLVKGGSLENALVLGENGPVNVDGFRGAGEILRHKLLDLIGDLALSGTRFSGTFRARRPGHAFTHKFLEKILRVHAS